MKYSIRFKLTLLLMVLMASTILFSYMIANLQIRDSYVEALKKRMVDAYRQINLIFSDEGLNSAEIQKHLSMVAADVDANVLVMGNDQNIYSNIIEQSEMYDSMHTIVKILREPQSVDISGFTGESNEGFYLISRNYDNQMDTEFYDLVGVLDDASLINIRSSVTRLDESVKITSRLFGIVGLAATVFGCIAMFFVSNRFAKPIQNMAAVAKRMSNLDFEATIDVRANDEIGELGKSMNLLSKELETKISELKTANNELTQDNEKKAQIDEMRKEFLSHVSHELKTPIALIQGYAEGLKENISEDLESREFYCEVIIDEANKMNQMVKKLLVLNEIEFGQEQVHIIRFNIVELIQNIIQASDILIQQNELVVHFDASAPCYVWADEFMIAEVVTNYLTNAIHHTPKGKNIHITLEEKEKNVRVKVFNEGVQIPEEDVEKIWIKFYKVDKARTREYGGSGIGLSIVAATMKAHKKEYGVVNEENGVTFYFDLEFSG